MNKWDNPIEPPQCENCVHFRPSSHKHAQAQKEFGSCVVSRWGYARTERMNGLQDCGIEGLLFVRKPRETREDFDFENNPPPIGYWMEEEAVVVSKRNTRNESR